MRRKGWVNPYPKEGLPVRGSGTWLFMSEEDDGN